MEQSLDEVAMMEVTDLHRVDNGLYQGRIVDETGRSVMFTAHQVAQHLPRVDVPGIHGIDRTRIVTHVTNYFRERMPQTAYNIGLDYETWVQGAGSD